MFEHVDAYAGDPILTLVETFHKDTREQKVNLGIGLYYDEQGRIPLLPSVQQAEAQRAAAPAPRPTSRWKAPPTIAPQCNTCCLVPTMKRSRRDVSPPSRPSVAQAR